MKAPVSLRSLARHVQGTVAVYVVIAAPVLLGIGALTLDIAASFMAERRELLAYWRGEKEATD